MLFKLRLYLLLGLALSFMLVACSEPDPVTAPEIVTQAAFGGYDISAKKTQTWRGGYKGAVVLKNKTGATVNSFEIKFKLKGGSTFLNGWNGTFSNPSANGTVTLKSPSYFGSLARGASYESGFVAEKAFAGATVISLKVNGNSVGGGTPAPAPTPVPTPNPAPNPNPNPPNPPTPGTPQGIPRPFDLFTVIDNYVLRPEFGKVSRWYQEYPGKQVFRLFVGDEYNGARKHARTEAGGGLKFRPGGAWHEFEARMKLSNKLDYTYTVAQLFAGCCGPQARIEIKPDGRVHMGSRSNTNVRISPDADYANGRRTFKIKIRTNGDIFQVYFNNQLKYTGTTEESQKGNYNVLYHFRWGVYSNYKMTQNLTNTVTEISRF